MCDTRERLPRFADSCEHKRNGFWSPSGPQTPNFKTRTFCGAFGNKNDKTHSRTHKSKDDDEKEEEEDDDHQAFLGEPRGVPHLLPTATYTYYPLPATTYLLLPLPTYFLSLATYCLPPAADNLLPATCNLLLPNLLGRRRCRTLPLPLPLPVPVPVLRPLPLPLPTAASGRRDVSRAALPSRMSVPRAPSWLRCCWVNSGRLTVNRYSPSPGP